MYIGMNMANGKTEEKTDYTQNAKKRDKENSKNVWKEISKNSSCGSRKTDSDGDENILSSLYCASHRKNISNFCVVVRFATLRESNGATQKVKRETSLCIAALVYLHFPGLQLYT